MKRSVDEKLLYNKQRKSPFSVGYVIGVTAYRDYPKSGTKYKATVRSLISNSNDLARMGDDYGKGVMCGVRDAANERKARNKDRPP